MGQPAARVGDMHLCPMFDGPKPHVGGPVLPPGKVNVLIGGMPAARVLDKCFCASVPDRIVWGSFTVLIGGRPAARMGDITMHGGVIVKGCPTVTIGLIGFSLNGLLSALTSLIDALENEIASLAQAVANKLVAIIIAIEAKIKAIVNEIISTVTAIAKRVATIVSRMANAVMRAATAATDWASQHLRPRIPVTIDLAVAVGFASVVWIRKKMALDPEYGSDGYWGTQYVGPTPNFQAMKEAGVTPVDLVDAAAQRHDQIYSTQGKAGIMSALFDPKVAHADRSLADDAREVMEGYYRGDIDPFTNQPISRRTFTEAYLVHSAFDKIATGKEAIEIIDNAASRMGSTISQTVEKAVDGITNLL